MPRRQPPLRSFPGPCHARDFHDARALSQVTQSLMGAAGRPAPRGGGSWALPLPHSLFSVTFYNRVGRKMPVFYLLLFWSLKIPGVQVLHPLRRIADSVLLPPPSLRHSQQRYLLPEASRHCPPCGPCPVTPGHTPWPHRVPEVLPGKALGRPGARRRSNSAELPVGEGQGAVAPRGQAGLPREC